MFDYIETEYALVAVKREWVPGWLWSAMSVHSPWTFYGLWCPPAWWWIRPIMTRSPRGEDEDG